MADLARIPGLYSDLCTEISKVIIGKDDVKRALLIALLVDGHVLIEGLPGTAKTSIVKAFATAVGGEFKRIQFTPDMMPVDITGFYIYSLNGSSRYVSGPIFANIVLADELNRTTPRTQSALLQAMQEHQVTIERTTYQLPDPFMIIATQVYTGSEGTYPLTSVQADRFLLRVDSVYASRDEEKRILTNFESINLPDIKPVMELSDVQEMRKLVRSVYVAPEVMDYITDIIDRLRRNSDTLPGPSTRATLALYQSARVVAMLDGRDFVIPDDIKQMLVPAVEHRIRVKPETAMDEITPRMILKQTLAKVTVPKLTL